MVNWQGGTTSTWLSIWANLEDVTNSCRAAICRNCTWNSTCTTSTASPSQTTTMLLLFTNALQLILFFKLC